MPADLETIARENLRSSGYLTRPCRERAVSWAFAPLPRRLFYPTDTVRCAIQRREDALHRQQTKSTFLQNCLNAFLDR